MNDKSKQKAFYVIFGLVILLALGGRLLAFSSSAGKIGNPDGHDYLNIGQSLSQGHGFALKTDDKNIVFRTFIIDNQSSIPDYQATATRPPLTCFWLALCLKCGLSLSGIQFLQVLVSTVSVALVFLLIWQITASTKKAAFASLLLALNPFSIYLASEIGTEWLFEFLLVSSICQGTLCLTQNKGQWKLGLLFGLLILCRPPGLVILFFFSIAVLFFRSKNWKRDLVIPNAVALMVFLPWVIRCSLLFSAFVPIASNGGQSFWSSWVRAEHFQQSELNQGFYSHGTAKIRKDIKDMNEMEVSAFLKNDAIQRVIKRPDRFFPVLGDHFLDIFRLMIKSDAHKNKTVLVYCSAAFLLALYLMTLMAIWQSQRSRRLLFIVVSAFFITHIISVCHIRHRNAFIDATCSIAIGLALARKKRDPELEDST